MVTLNEIIMKLDYKMHCLKFKVNNIKSNVSNHIRYRLNRFAISIIVNLNKNSSYIKHFLKEYEYKGECKGVDKLMRDQVIELLSVLATQGDTMSSIGFKRKLFDRAASFKLLYPLTFKDEEFSTDKEHCQNKRLTSVFKYNDGTYRDIDALSHTILDYRYDKSLGKIVEYEFGGIAWSGNIILYNKNDESYHYYRPIITNFDNFMGKNQCSVKTIEVYDSNDKKNDFICNVGCLQDVPENFFKDYQLVIEEEFDKEDKDVLEFCKEVNIYKYYEEAISKSI